MDMYTSPTCGSAADPQTVLIEAPKNGFLYVIDRTNGKLISAEPFAKVTWASRIDLATGRPVETQGVRFPDGKSFSSSGQPSARAAGCPARSARRPAWSRLPKLETGAIYSDRGIDPEELETARPQRARPWRNVRPCAEDPPEHERAARLGSGRAAQGLVGAHHRRFQRRHPRHRRQPRLPGADRRPAQRLCGGQRPAALAVSAQAAVVAAPITYRAKGIQYVTVLVSMGTTAGSTNARWAVSGRCAHPDEAHPDLPIIGGTATCPTTRDAAAGRAADPDYRPDPAAGGARRRAVQPALRGLPRHQCRGRRHRARPARLGRAACGQAFAAIVRDGALVQNGIPRSRN